MLRIVSSRCAG